MGIRLLGPLELRTVDGDLIEVPGAQRRAVLALLALEVGHPVPLSRFFELLWGNEPPVHARAALQGHIAVLRKLLPETRFTLTTRSTGYQLDGDAGDVDALLIASLLQEAASIEDDRVAAGRLLHAIGVWAGEPVADLPDTELRRALARTLHNTYAATVGAWAERLLRLGEGSKAVPLLEQQVLADELAEPSIALLMRCLQQAGRSSDAIAAYHRARARLRDELGIVPGPSLQHALADVLAAVDPGVPATEVSPAAPERPAPQVPNQLPRRPGAFTGRTQEIDWLERQCGNWSPAGTLALVVGPAGVGKTSTVVRWAHTVGQAYPDGRLFADLGGFSNGGAEDVAEVLTRFLLALGVPESTIPADPAERVALYRERTADRRLLVILDNARTAAEVLELVPSGETCTTVVTSRNSLEDLVVTDGAVMLRVETLTETDALALLRRLLTAERVDADLASASRVLALCDRLPLALRVAAARLLGSPSWGMADLARYLGDERTRLRALETGGEISLRSALNLTYRHLPAPAAELLALLAVHPGVEIDTFAAGALLDGGPQQARQALAALSAYHLLVESSPGRYSRHDLIRLYSTELVEVLGPDAKRHALRRLVSYYRAALGAAVETVGPSSSEVTPAADPGLALPDVSSIGSAVTWFRSEEPGLRALIEHASRHGEAEAAWHLARTSDTLYACTDLLSDRVSCMRAGLRAAEHSADPTALPSMLAATAAALNSAGQPAEALRLAQQAVSRTAAEDGDAHVGALMALATITAGLGRVDAAAELFEKVLAILRATGLRAYAAPAFANAAALKGVTGDTRTALRYARVARRLLADRPSAPYQISAMVNEAHALAELGRRREAEELWVEALRLCTSSSSQVRALAERQYAEFLLTVGRRSEAAGHLRRAIDLYTVRGNLLVVQHLADQLAQLERTD